MTKRIYLTMLVLLLAVSGIFAQNPEVKIGNVTAGPGEILVPVQMLNFTANVNSFTFKINVNSNLLQFVELTNKVGFTGPNYQAYQNGNLLSIVYYDLGTGYLPNGKVFDMKFTYTGAANTTLAFGSGNEVTAGIFPVDNITYTNGVVTTTQPIPDPVVKIGDVITAPGAVTVPVEMLNFSENINSLTFKVDVPADLVQFVQLSNTDAGFAGGTFMYNHTGDVVNIQWQSAGAGFLPTGHVFDLTLNYVGGFNTDLEWLPGNEVTYAASQVENVSYIKGSITQVPSVGTVTIGSANAVNGEGVSLPVSFSGAGFSNVSAYTLFLHYDNSKLVYQGASNLLSGDIQINQSAGTVAIAWQGSAANLSAATILNLNFVYQGVSTADLEFVPGCEVNNASATPLAVTYVDGQVSPTASDKSITIAEVTTFPGQIVTVPVTALNVGTVGAVDIYINFDNTKATLGAYSFAQLSNWLVNQTPSQISFKWQDIAGATIADGALINLEFQYLGGGVADIEFTTGTEVTGTNALPINVNFNNGSIASSTGSSTATIASVTSCNQNTAVVAVTLANVADVTSFTFPIGFDASVLTFVELTNVNPLLVGYQLSFNANSVNIAWQNTSAVNLNGKLFDMVFDYSGMVSPVIFDAGSEITGANAMLLPVTFVDGEVDCNIDYRVLTLSKVGNGNVVVKDGATILSPDMAGGNQYTVFYGTVLTLEATGDEGWQFSGWQGSVNNLNNATTSINMINDFAVTANFTMIDYLLSLNLNPVAGGTVTGEGIYHFGDAVTISAVANTGWAFVSWTNAAGDVVATTPGHTFSMPSSDLALTANFAMIDYTLTLVASPVAGGTVTGAGVYHYGDQVAVDALPNIGYHFVSWTDGSGAVVSTTPANTISMPANDYTLTANFELNTYTVTLVANPVAGGTVTGAGTYTHGTVASVNAVANVGYHFVNWTDATGAVASSSASNDLTITGDLSLTANFELNSYTVTLVANPVAGGTVSGAGTYTHGSVASVNAVANTGYTFVNWTDATGAVVSGTAASNITVTSDLNLTANFVLNTYTVTLVANPVQGGTVSGGGTYNHGSVASVNAVPTAGWEFVNWTDATGAVVSTNASNDITVTSDLSLTANFNLVYVASFPFSEDYEGAAFPPMGWSVFDVDASATVRTWASSTSQNHTTGGGKSAKHAYGPSSQTEDGWLVTPKIPLPAGIEIELAFWSYNAFPSYYGKNSVLISTSGNNPASGNFTELWTVASVTAAWSETTIDLSAYAGQEVFIAFRYEGSDAHDWYLDDVTVDEKITVPTIVVDPMILTETHLVPPSQTTTQVVTISNTGGVDLTWDLAVNTNRSGSVANTAEDYSRLATRISNDPRVSNSLGQAGVSGGMSPNQTRDAIIRYDDGTNYDAIGLTNGGTFQVAAYFPASEMGQYAGMKLDQVEIYINDVPSPCVLKVYGAGSPTSPGALLHEQTITPTGMSFNLITLSNQVDITGQDLWIGYEVTHAGGAYPAGCDAGPAVVGYGDMISTDGVAWDPLSSFGLNYNWNIAGYLVPGVTYTNDVGVFSLVSPVSGADLGDETVTVRVKNFGTAPQSNISVSYTLDGGTAVSGTIAGPLAAGATYDYTFAGTVNLGTVGQTYVFHACATVTGDENTVNDCKNYNVTNVMPVYCDATTGTEDEYIGNVLFGTINNSSGWQGGVADYTAQYTVIESGMSEAITVTNPVPYSSDKVTAWVDWNMDYTYATGGDEEYVLTSDGTGAVFTGSISVPAGTPEGMYRMRVRLTYSTAPAPCGSATYGEVEEYTIQVGAGVPPTPWLSADVLSGTIPAGGSTQVTVSFNSENLALGTYNGSLVITSNDPVNATVTVPVTFNVEESDVCYPSPRNLAGTTQGQDVTLTWQAPDFTGGGGGTTQDFVEGFEAGTLPTGWVTYNVDGDAYDWENSAVNYSTFTAHTGLYCMASASYVNGVGALTPNNWLVTPALAVTDASQLKFWVSAQDPSWSAEQYYVKVSTTGNAVADFTTTLHDAISGTAWEEVVINLGSYAGQTIYLAFQHADVTDMYFIKIDDVTVTATGTKAGYTAAVAPGTTRGISFKTQGMSQSEIDARLNPQVSYTFGESAETTTTGGQAQILPQGIKHMSGSRNRALLYDNGPFINSPGTGPNGTDQSILQNVTLGMNTLGAGIQFASGNHMADDFVVDETWTVESFTFYGYQTGSPTTSTMTGGYLQIWDGDPTAGGQIIWGDMTTNLMSSTAWTNAYRLSEGTPGTTRPVMSITCATSGLTLEPGTYWVEYTLNGSLASGPWAPPITINGQAVTGNAKQYLGSTSEWVDFLDTGTGTPAQGLPFLIEGETGGGGPECPHGELLGYNVYRNGSKIGETVASVRTYIDNNVAPGTYTYGVTAVYGQPYPGESVPVTTPVTVNQSAVFPFEEMWASNNFTGNGWTFDPSQGNWAMSTMGNPAPAAQFGWSPSTTNYSFALVSKDIAATQAVDNVTLQFDISLDDYSNTSAEMMKVYVWNGTAWVLIDTFVNAADIPWTTKSYDVTTHALGKTTKVKFEASGATTFDIDYWYIDNIKVFDGEPVLNPNITVNPAAMQFWVPMGGSQSQPLAIGNTGEGPLNWSASIQYLTRMETTPVAVPGGPKVEQGILEFSQAGAQPGGSPQTDTRDAVVLNYDGDNYDAIGLTSGGAFYVAARFPSDMVSPYAGYNMESVDVYINNMPSSSTLKIWGAGSNNAPGALLYEQAFTGSEASWVTVTLSSGVALTGEDIWVGYSLEHAASMYPAGCDAGPANPNGDWISMDGAAWEHLAGYGLNYNWNIRALINGSSYSWLTLSSTSGVVAPGASQTITAAANSTGLGAGPYYANVRIASNDPDTPVKIVPTELHVGVGLHETDMSKISVYPVPASSQLTIDMVEGVTTLRMLNYMGQVVHEINVAGSLKHQLNVSELRSGAYTLQFINSRGDIYNKTVIINR